MNPYAYISKYSESIHDAGPRGHIEGKEVSLVALRKKVAIVLTAVVAIAIYFWAVAVIERRGYIPDHPNAVENDPQPLFVGDENEKPAKDHDQRKTDTGWPNRRWFQDPWVVGEITLTLAVLALLMHLRQRRKPPSGRSGMGGHRL